MSWNDYRHIDQQQNRDESLGLPLIETPPFAGAKVGHPTCISL